MDDQCSCGLTLPVRIRPTLSSVTCRYAGTVVRQIVTIVLAAGKRHLHDGVMPTAGHIRRRMSDTGQAPVDDSSQRRWEEMLGSLAALLPAGCRRVLVDGPTERASLFASRLADKLAAERHPGPVRVTLDADGAWDVVVFLRTAPGGRHFPVYEKDSTEEAARDRREREERADIVIDLHDVRLAGDQAGGRAAGRARLVVPDGDPRVLRLPGRDLGRQVRRRPARVLRGGRRGGHQAQRRGHRRRAAAPGGRCRRCARRSARPARSSPWT